MQDPKVLHRNRGIALSIKNQKQKCKTKKIPHTWKTYHHHHHSQYMSYFVRYCDVIRKPCRELKNKTKKKKKREKKASCHN